MEASQPGLLDMVSGTTSPARLSVANTSTDTVSPEVAEIERETNSRANPTAQQSQIAYSYGYGFRIGSDEIVNLQKAHIAMCDKMGNECRVLRTSQARADSYDAYGELRMQIAASKAGSLTEQLSAPAKEMGGALISSVRDGEDLSEQIIDSEARLNSRLALRDKLTGILQGNRGSVQELIEAEAAIAEVNEELDATRSRLEQFRNRIRYSDVRIEYEPAFGDTQVGFVRPVMTALRSIGSTLGVSIAGIIYTITALMPVALLLLALRWVLHRFGYRLRFWKNDLRRGSEAEA